MGIRRAYKTTPPFQGLRGKTYQSLKANAFPSVPPRPQRSSGAAGLRVNATSCRLRPLTLVAPGSAPASRPPGPHVLSTSRIWRLSRWQHLEAPPASTRSGKRRTRNSWLPPHLLTSHRSSPGRSSSRQARGQGPGLTMSSSTRCGARRPPVRSTTSMSPWPSFGARSNAIQRSCGISSRCHASDTVLPANDRRGCCTLQKFDAMDRAALTRRTE